MGAVRISLLTIANKLYTTCLIFLSGLRVGYEDTIYSVNEGNGIVELCVRTFHNVLSPRSFTLTLSTINISASKCVYKYV